MRNRTAIKAILPCGEAMQLKPNEKLVINCCRNCPKRRCNADCQGPLRSTEDASWAVLDLFGWRRGRAGNPDRALAVFRRNLALFPDEYIPNESMGDALWFLEDDVEGAIEIFEQWFERHPEHVMAQRRVATLRAERQF